MRRPWTVVVLLVIVTALVSACASQSLYQTQVLKREARPTRVLLMPVDVAIYELTAGGLLEPKADWTASARTNVREAVVDSLRQRTTEVVVYVEGPGEPEVRRDQIQLVKLHEAVGQTILVQKYHPGGDLLPTKKGVFDWSLGPKVASLRDEYDADYALFVFLRDSHSSGGRVAAGIMMALLFGVALPGGQQLGFASLVDLETGDIVWFNRSQSGFGDLRTPEASRSSVAELMTDFPQ
ncbi:MAG: hypothetical protein ACFCUO_11955 [Rhodospirillales bacterium]